MSTPFQEELRWELSLTSGGQSFTIPGGQVKHVSARMAPHGFSASLTFWTTMEKKDAPLFLAFQKPDLIEVRLAVSEARPQAEPPPAPLVLRGLVRGRRLQAETHGALKGEARVFRRYTVEFADPAQVLWRQHRPTELHTDMSMAEILEAHKASLQLSLDWATLKIKQPLFCLALGADAPGVSFYDFVLWYVHTHQGVFTYDSQKNQYLLTDSKPAEGQPANLSPLSVQSLRVHVPAPIRHGTRVLNALAAAPTTQALEQPQAVAGVSHDVLLREPLATRAEARQKQEKTRLQVRQPRYQLAFKDFPPVNVFPGARLQLTGPLWAAGLTGRDEDLRVQTVELEARADDEGQHAGQANPSATFQTRVALELESAAEPAVALPAFRAPRYPIHVEGLVHSPGGEPEDRRYLISEDEKTSIHSFRMTVPLWNKTVSVLAEPIHFPGQFFFPPYKNTRVLVALHHERAELLRFLDWKEGVRPPQDGQGDQILLGQNKKSQTALTHDFQDDKPVWRMLRTSGGDTQVVRMGEGHLFIQVKESEASAAPTPTYDVSPQVQAAKGDLTASVGESIGMTSTAYQGAMGATRAKMKSAQAEAKTALSGARKEVGAKVAEAKGTLNGAAARLDQGTGELAAAAASAKASLEKLR
ncbi:hypothetical protein I3V78_21690 [Archangium primigenium]|nr:hypothetical protein [Archangium primigenium]